MSEQEKKSVAKTILKAIFKVVCVLGGGKIKGAVVFLGAFVAGLAYFIYKVVQGGSDINAAFGSGSTVFLVLWIGCLILRLFFSKGGSGWLSKASDAADKFGK